MNKPSREKKAAGTARYVTAGPGDAGQRLDNFLRRQLKGVPKSLIYRLLRTGQVRVNRGRARPDRRLAEGDEIRLPPVRTAQEAPAGRPPRGLLERLEAGILFEDERLLVINKPAGVAVHGGSGLSFGVIECLRQLRPEAKELELVHRLDRETSGCLILARRRSALRALHAQLRGGRVGKHYLALVAGAWRGGRVALALAKNRLQGGERMVKVTAEGKSSASLFRPVRRLAGATLMEVEILTGRTHQIRVHAAESGHPVLGDEKYGDREANRRARTAGLKRMFLHAARIEFEHPASGERVVVEAPLDDELRGVLEALERT